MATTFKELQTDVLRWMADEGDTGLMRDLVKQAINASHRKLLAGADLDFMLSPLMTLTVAVGQKAYALPENFLSLLYVKNAVDYLEEMPAKAIMEADEGLVDAGDLSRFSLTRVEGVQAQPVAPAVVVIATTGGTESASNGIIVEGQDSSGNVLRETLTSGTAWTSLTTTGTFATITRVFKTGETWSRLITVTVGATTVLVLSASIWAKQYQVLEFAQTPLVATTVTYRYFLQPDPLVYDYQPTQLPDVYRDLLVYDALLLMPGYTRATPEELSVWSTTRMELHQQLQQNYQQARSLGARARRIRMIERT